MLAPGLRFSGIRFHFLLVVSTMTSVEIVLGCQASIESMAKEQCDGTI